MREIGKWLSCRPAPRERIVSIGQYILPKDYVEFIHEFNAAEGSLERTEYLALWPVEELERLNEGYATAEFRPGILLFGSDGGGMAYGFDYRCDGEPSIVAAPFDSIDAEDMSSIADSFTSFVLDLDRN